MTGTVEWVTRWCEGERDPVPLKPVTPYRAGARAALAVVKSGAADGAYPAAPETVASATAAPAKAADATAAPEITARAAAAPPGRRSGWPEARLPYRWAPIRVRLIRAAPIRLGPIRPAIRHGTFLIGEGAPEPTAPALTASAAGEKLRIVVAGCRLLTDSLLDAARPYAGLASFTAADCGLDPLAPEVHLEEPDGALPPGLERLAAGADALVLPPGVPPRVLAMVLVPAARVELRPACVLDLVRSVQAGTSGGAAGGAAGSSCSSADGTGGAACRTGVPAGAGPAAGGRPRGAAGAASGAPALVLPASVIARPLAAVLEEHLPGAPLLTYVGLDHLWSQLKLVARLRPARVLADPAAAALARRSGLPVESIYAGAGRCLLLHPLERAIARAVLSRLGMLSHEGQASVAAPGGTIDTLRPDPGRSSWTGPIPRDPAQAHDMAAGLRRRALDPEPVRDVLAVRAARRFVLVPSRSIVYLASRGGLVTVHADSGEFWTDRPLGELEARLDARHFLRLDASRLVNVTRISELVPWTHQRYRLRLADAAKTELVLSRDIGRRLRALLGW